MRRSAIDAVPSRAMALTEGTSVEENQAEPVETGAAWCHVCHACQRQVVSEETLHQEVRHRLGPRPKHRLSQTLEKVDPHPKNLRRLLSAMTIDQRSIDFGPSFPKLLADHDKYVCLTGGQRCQMSTGQRAEEAAKRRATKGKPASFDAAS